MKVKGIRHVGIETNNMKEMIRFYRDILGLELYWDRLEKPEHTGFDEPVRTVKLKCKDGTVIELVNNHKYQNHFALNVLGTKRKVGWIKDPDGNMLEVVNETLQ